MGRGLGFSKLEDDFIASNAEGMTAEELFDLYEEVRHEFLWPERSEKSIARRVERLREEGHVGFRDAETRRKAYYLRTPRTES